MWPFIALTCAALAVVLYTERRDAAIAAAIASGGPSAPGGDRLRVVGAVAKVVASCGFIGAAIAGGAFGSFFGQTLFIALVWCFAGDVLLIAKGSRPAFMFGIAAFLMGHLGYVMCFRMRGVDGVAALVAGLALGVVALFIWRWLSPHLRGGMRIAVACYIGVITLMVAFAIGTVALAWSPVPLVAAVLFWLSDLTVARQRFVRASFWNRAVGLPLYYAAQLVFVTLLDATSLPPS